MTPDNPPPDKAAIEALVREINEVRAEEYVPHKNAALRKAAEALSRMAGEPRIAEWQPMDSAPIDGAPFWAIVWLADYPFKEGVGRWSDPVKYAFATRADDEQCWHSIPRQSCIRKIDTSRWRWMLLPSLPAPPAPPAAPSPKPR